MAADTPDDVPPLSPADRPDARTERELREAEDLALAASGLGSGLLKRQPLPESDDSVAVLKVCPQCSTEYETAARFCPADGTSLRPKGSDSLIDRVLAERYHILKRIGEGGMGRVYLGEHVKMNRQCAIKVMNPALVNDHESATRFAREASSAARIIHPNVAAVFDFGESDGLVYLVMEFVDGEPLSQILTREAPLGAARAVDIARQVAEGLGAAHELGIVHRDLKPDNILIARSRAGKQVAKVVDFGIAKAAQEAASEALTRTGLVIGTPEFMSPEQLLGDPIDARSDLYALGCIMHLMLTAIPPFEAETREQMIKRRLAEDAPHVQAIDPTLPDSLDRIVYRLLARSPAERYGSAAEVIDALTGTHLRPSGSSAAVRDPRERPTPRSAPTIAFESLQRATTEVNASSGDTVMLPVARAGSTPRRPLLLAAGGAVAVGAALLLTHFIAAPSAPPVIAAGPAIADSLSRDTVVTPAPAAVVATLPTSPPPDTAPKKIASATPVTGTSASRSGRDDSAAARRQKQASRRTRDSSVRAESAVPSVVHDAVNAYASAIASRDINRVQAAYPRLSDSQRDGWKRLFDASETIGTSVSYGNATVTPTSIDAPFTMQLRITNHAKQRSSSSPPLQHARFEKAGNSWVLREIR